MQKEFDVWNGLKKQINLKPRVPENEAVDVGGVYVHPREIWWFSTGVNVGSEIDGKNSLFERPGIILKTHNQFTSTIIPISSNKPEMYFSYNFLFNDVIQSAILSQAKLIDHKRLSRKIGTLDNENFQRLKNKFLKYYKYETPLSRGISEAEAISSNSITPTQNLSSPTASDKNFSDQHRSFKLSQQAVIVNDKNEVLILKSTEASKTDLWLLPGGRVDVGENNLEEALKRELKEEINLEKISIKQVVGTGVSTGFNTIAIAYLVEVEDVDNLRLSDEHEKFQWVNSVELEKHLYYKKIGREIYNHFKSINPGSGN